jgi:hypothetical protein
MSCRQQPVNGPMGKRSDGDTLGPGTGRKGGETRAEMTGAVTLEDLDAVQVVLCVDDVLIPVHSDVGQGDAAREARGRQMLRRLEAAGHPAKHHVDRVQIGIGDDEIEDAVVVDVTGYHFERSAAEHDLIALNEALSLFVHQDRDGLPPGVDQCQIHRAVAVEVAGGNAARRVGCQVVRSRERRCLCAPD